jgi:pyruvate dehydrogenase E1 component alpha subunit
MRRARDERQPALLETTTYRFRGHSVADAGKVYRAAEEVAEAKKHDPIDRFVAQMSIDAETVARLRSEVNAEIDAAIRQAAADPAPDPAGLFDNVYGDPDWREQFSRMERGGPFGEREGTRSWRA